MKKIKRGRQKTTSRQINFRVKTDKDQLLADGLQATGLNETDFLNALLDEIPNAVRRILAERKAAQDRVLSGGKS